MAQREDFLTPGASSSTSMGTDTDFGGDRNSDQIRSDIDRTRAELDETFSALESKLTPGQIMEEAWGLFKGGSSAGMSKVFRIVREHPLPSAVIGLGAGWLLVESSRKSESREDYGYDYDRPSRSSYGTSSYGTTGYGSGSYNRNSLESSGYGEDWEAESSGRLSAAKDKVKDVASNAREAVSDAADTVGEKASHLKDQALDLGHRAQEKAGTLRRKAGVQAWKARTGFWQTLEQNPLLVGAATLALGVVAGMVLPSTDREDELMGETRDHLVDQAKELGQEALDKGKQVVSTVGDKLKDEAEHQGLTPQNLVEKVKTVAQEATNVAKEEVKKQAPALANAAPDQGPKPGEAQGAQPTPPPAPAPGAQSPAPAQGQAAPTPKQPELAKR